MKLTTLYLILLSISAIISTETQKLSTIEKILGEFSNKSKKDLFKVYHLIFKKTYDLSTDYAKERFRTFKQNLKEIEAFNALDDSHQKGIGEFTDLTEKEFEDQHLMNAEISNEIEKFMEEPEDDDTQNEDDDDDLTKRFLKKDDDKETYPPIDYTGKLVPVKDEGKKCLASWAFAAVNTVEYLYADKKLSLSEQQLIDCNSKNGCKGGNPVKALFDIKKTGLEKSSDYKYQGEDSKCKYDEKKVAAKIDKVSICKGKKHKAEEGSVEKRDRPHCGAKRLYHEFLFKGVPLVIFDGIIIKDYKKGIIEKEAEKCRRPSAVGTVVGYGVDSKTKKAFWKIRVPLGKNFGEDGYFRIAVHSKKGACFIEKFAAIASKKSK